MSVNALHESVLFETRCGKALAYFFERIRKISDTAARVTAFVAAGEIADMRKRKSVVSRKPMEESGLMSARTQANSETDTFKRAVMYSQIAEISGDPEDFIRAIDLACGIEDSLWMASAFAAIAHAFGNAP